MATFMHWLAGKPQRVLTLRKPSDIPQLDSYTDHHEWSILDDQIMLTYPARKIKGENTVSTVYLADIQDVPIGDNAVDFANIATLPFYASQSSLLSNRTGFVTLEIREDEDEVVLRTHNWTGRVTKEKVISTEGIGRRIVIHGSLIALCVSCEGSQDQEIEEYGQNGLNQIVIWDIESDDVTRVKIPQDERAPQTHEGNFQFAGSSHIALGGHVDPSFDKPSSVLRSFSISPADNFSRYFTHGQNFEFGDDHDVIAIPGSSADSDVVVHYHQRGYRLTAANVGLLTGEIHSESLPSPGYFTDPDYHKDLFHTFMDKTDARTLHGVIAEFLPSLVNNRLLVELDIREYDDDEYSETPAFFLYDFDQARCKTLCELSTSQRKDLETKLNELNQEAQVTVVSRMFYTSIEDEDDKEKTQSPEWKNHFLELQRTQIAREHGEAKIPLLEFDDAPEDQKDSPRMLFTKTKLCIPNNSDRTRGSKWALTTSAIITHPTSATDGKIYYFGKDNA